MQSGTIAQSWLSKGAEHFAEATFPYAMHSVHAAIRRTIERKFPSCVIATCIASTVAHPRFMLTSSTSSKIFVSNALEFRESVVDEAALATVEGLWAIAFI